jgi:hypothetical protein
MLGLPKSTEFNRRIPKQKFYENIDISPVLKRVFIEKIRIIYWRNKIAPTTVNLAQGEKVTEIEVFEVRLTEQMQPEPVLRQIDKAIPYHIVFLLEYEGRYQAWTAYKEASSGVNAFKVHSYYHTDWLPEEDLPLKLEGLNIDKVYENFVRQIGGESLTAEGEETLQQSVERDIHRQDLQKQIAALQAKVRKEKQLNKQVQLNAELKKLKKELEDL